jgi:predicted MPP superfamily phosphohydrolase
VIKYIKDLKPDIVILGGDIIDAEGLHGVESFKVTDFKKEWYRRDIKLLNNFLQQLQKAAPKATYIYLEGNHEERYTRLMNKYKDTFSGDFDFIRDAAPKGMKIKWIPYGTYDSFYKLGDTIFLHGNLYPDLHAKKYALDYSPFKCIYGHLHHFQSYTTRSSLAARDPHYAVTAGCLCSTAPEWKKGAPNQWINGFISFVCDDGRVMPQVHLIENKKFYVGGKEYK